MLTSTDWLLRSPLDQTGTAEHPGSLPQETAGFGPLDPTRPYTLSGYPGEAYAVGWGTLALINAGLAQGKNRSGTNWFLLSLVFGPIATFLLVVFSPKLAAE